MYAHMCTAEQLKLLLAPAVEVRPVTPTAAVTTTLAIVKVAANINGLIRH